MNIDAWDWVPGVGLYGLFKGYEITRNETILNFLINWTDTHLEKAYELKTVNSTAPLLTVLKLYQITKKENYLKVCKEIAQWVVNDAKRTKEGGFEHTVTEAGAGFSEQIWADTLFMVCIFLADLGKELNDRGYIDEACSQLVIHHKLLKDKATGLFYHGWNCEQKDWMSGAFWGRANAWITLSTVEMLSALPDEFSGRDFILHSLSRQVSALFQYQREDGLFGTLIDDTDRYGETSATAGICYGVKKGIELGYINRKYMSIYNKGIKELKLFVAENGELGGVSTGTPVMPTKEAYKNIEVYPTLYGQSLAILAFTLE